MSTSAPARRVLIVEHDFQLGEFLARLLREAGYETNEAASLEEAFSKVDGQLYDFVLTDLLAPAPPSRANTAYLSAVQQLRQRCHPIPVGILTGWRIDPEGAQRAGFAFAMEKPYDIDVVLRYIADRLNAPFSPEQHQQAQALKRLLHAVSLGDGETLRVLCTPGVCYFPLTGSPFTEARQIIGFEAYLAYVHQVRQRLPDLRFEPVTIFQQRERLIARYNLSWQGAGGQRRWITGSVQCRFFGERISRIGEAWSTKQLRQLLEPPQPDTGI